MLPPLAPPYESGRILDRVAVAGAGIAPADVRVMSATSLFCSIPAVSSGGIEPTATNVRSVGARATSEEIETVWVFPLGVAPSQIPSEGNAWICQDGKKAWGRHLSMPGTLLLTRRLRATPQGPHAMSCTWSPGSRKPRCGCRACGQARALITPSPGEPARNRTAPARVAISLVRLDSGSLSGQWELDPPDTHWQRVVAPCHLGRMERAPSVALGWQAWKASLVLDTRPRVVLHYRRAGRAVLSVGLVSEPVTSNALAWGPYKGAVVLDHRH